MPATGAAGHATFLNIIFIPEKSQMNCIGNRGVKRTSRGTRHSRGGMWHQAGFNRSHDITAAFTPP